jgi:putative hydrolase of the HAD superfamily
MRRPALIFDFGNVVAFFDYSRFHRAICRRTGIAETEFSRRLADRGYSDLHERFERGEMCPLEFSRAFRERYALDLSRAEFEAAWSGIFRLNAPVASLVSRLKSRGYRLLLGSNTNEIHASHFRREFAATMDLFDHLVLSFEVRSLKPAADFYLACARAAGAIPSDCIFIDDLPENVEGARAAGLRPIHFVDPATLTTELIRQGVEL